MSSEVERLISECDEGDLEAWEELLRFLKRKNLGGEFFSVVSKKVLKLSRKPFSEEVYKKILKEYAIGGQRKGRKFHLYQKLSWGRRAKPECGGSEDHLMYALVDCTSRPLCRWCLKVYQKENPEIDLSAAGKLNDCFKKQGPEDPNGY